MGSSWAFIWLDHEFLGLLGFIREATWEAVISYYIASFYFDLSHAIRMLCSYYYLVLLGLRFLQDLKGNTAY